jgi:hypothetical protein
MLAPNSLSCNNPLSIPGIERIGTMKNILFSCLLVVIRLWDRTGQTPDFFISPLLAFCGYKAYITKN